MFGLRPEFEMFVTYPGREVEVLGWKVWKQERIWASGVNMRVFGCNKKKMVVF